ncbi:hypothetical protein N7520_008109 [Penicillium odoratum]|uniref:uncharacterized protein n=1 Tax=Penicillium odoratum TaxID=1167516 RepID=UPI002546CAE3|nr:uncharacterized protein N7520_008109 [Penicillium odoratum]KAJ5760953.1 hypothetical protein N7520_008109 [Penicillium odoratum]
MSTTGTNKGKSVSFKDLLYDYDSDLDQESDPEVLESDAGIPDETTPEPEATHKFPPSPTSAYEILGINPEILGSDPEVLESDPRIPDETTPDPEATTHESPLMPPPPAGQVFETRQSAIDSINNFAKPYGYSVSILRSKKGVTNLKCVRGALAGGSNRQEIHPNDRHPYIKIRDIYNIQAKIQEEILGGRPSIQALLLDLPENDEWLIRYANEQEDSYVFVLDCLKEVYAKEISVEHHLVGPRTIFTDHEPALMNAINDIFPDIDRMICLWHVMKNIKIKVRPIITECIARQVNDSILQKDEVKEQSLALWAEFKENLDEVFYFLTVKGSQRNWRIFRRKWDRLGFDEVNDYIMKVWIEGCGEHFMAC